MKIFVILITVSLGLPYALSPIHEASYQIRPNDVIVPDNLLHMGLYISPESRQKVRVPLSFSKGVNYNLELGAGLKTRWFDEPNNFRHLVFGAKYRIEDLMSVQADVLIGTANYAGNAVSFTLNKRIDYTSRFYSPIMARIGFLDALVWGPDGFMAMEAGYYPTLTFTQSLFFQLGIISSSQVGGFGDYFCLDLQPDLIIDLEFGSQLVIGTIVGLAGPRKASLRVQVLLNYSL